MHSRKLIYVEMAYTFLNSTCSKCKGIWVFLSSYDFMQYYCIIFFISKLCATDLMIYSKSTLTSSFTHDLTVYQRNHTKKKKSFFFPKV